MFTATKLVVAVVSAVLIGAFLASGVLTPSGSGVPGAAAPASPDAPRVAWTTERVALTADDLRLEVNDIVFGDAVWSEVSSDPGSSDYWTLEVIWTEHGVEQRLNMYLGSDGTDWWVDEIRTYDGYEQGEWVYAYGPLFQTPLGEAFEGDVSIDLRGEGRPGDPDALIPAVLSFDALRLAVSPGAARTSPSPSRKAVRLDRALVAATGDPLAGAPCLTSEEAFEAATAVLEELGMPDLSWMSGPPAREHECAVARANSDGSLRIDFTTVVAPAISEVLDEVRELSRTECLDSTTAIDTLTESLHAVGHRDFVVELDGPLGGPIDEQEELKAHAEAGCVSYATTGRDGNGTPVYYLYGG